MESPRSPRVGEEEPVLDEDGLVEAHVLPDLRDLRLGRLLAEEQLGRVPGDRPHHEEHHDRYPEKYGDDLEYPAPDELYQSPDLLHESQRASEEALLTCLERRY